MRLLPLLALIAMTRGGPYHHTGVLQPGEKGFFDLNAKVKDLKVIDIVGDKSSEFVCSVYDDSAHTVVIDLSNGDYCHMEFVAQSNHYMILVSNVGSSEDKFSLDSN